MRRISILKFSWLTPLLLIASLTACPASKEPSYLLEATVGTYNQQIGAGNPNAKLGTVFVVKLREESNQLPITPAQVSIQGPKDWNANQSFSFSYPAQSYWVSVPIKDAVPIAGEYKIQIQILGKTIEKTISLPQPTQTLALTKINTVVNGIVDAPIVRVSWQEVSGAIGYYAKIIDGTTGTVFSETKYTNATTEDFTVAAFSPSHAYFAVVVAAGLDTVVDDPSLVGQVNFSDSIEMIAFGL